MENISDALKQIDKEDFIWLVAFFIVIVALISNQYEKAFIKYKNIKDAKTYKALNIVILVVAFFIYLYFVSRNKEGIRSLRANASQEEVLLAHITYIASILFLTAGILFFIAEVFNKPTTPLEDPFF